ncbi:MAG: transporter [bacterium]|nr:MAG: transporter [bacterium]
MPDLIAITGEIAGFLWGLPMVLLLAGTGIYLTVGLRGIQIRKTAYALKLLFRAGGEKGEHDKGDISPLQALTTALSATVGTGNIAGVATAIASGGPGALFWMWMMGVIGMATKFSEIFLSLKFREVGPDGKMCGGPMYYIEKGLGAKWLAVTFAVCCVAASLGPGNMVQSNSIAAAAKNLFGLQPHVTGAIAATLVGFVILGGIARIGKVTEKLVPVMAMIYVIGGVAILLTHIDRVPGAIYLIVHSAFNPMAATGGFAGAMVSESIRYGVARGVFSNEAGLGSAPIAHAAAITHLPGRQALIGMIGVFIDTIVICTITGLVIVTTGVWDSGLTAVDLTTHAFGIGLPGPGWGGIIVSVGLILFAFTTFIGWSYYGLQCVEYLLGLKAALAYRWVFVALIFISADMKVDLIWNMVDILVAVMAVPNVIALLGLSMLVFSAARSDKDLL